MSDNELSRVVKVKSLTEEAYLIEADEVERTALAKRFDLSVVKLLEAQLQLTPDKSDVRANGTLTAEWLQPCAVSGEDFATSIKESLHFRFVRPHEQEPDEELELDAEDCDEIPFEGDAFDLGEAVAQSFGLLIDPYATGPRADAARQAAGISSDDEPQGPMAAALKGLRPS